MIQQQQRLAKTQSKTRHAKLVVRPERVENDIEQQYLLQEAVAPANSAMAYAEDVAPMRFAPPPFITYNEQMAKYAVAQQRAMYAPMSDMMEREREAPRRKVKNEEDDDDDDMHSRLLSTPMEFLAEEVAKQGWQDAKETMGYRDWVAFSLPTSIGSCIISDSAQSIVKSCVIRRMRTLLTAMLKERRKEQGKYAKELTELVQIEEGIKRDIDARMVVLFAQCRKKMAGLKNAVKQDSVCLALQLNLKQNMQEQRVTRKKYDRATKKVEFDQAGLSNLESHPTVDKDAVFWNRFSKHFTSKDKDKDLDDNEDAVDMFEDVKEVSREINKMMAYHDDDNNDDDGGNDDSMGLRVNEIINQCMERASAVEYEEFPDTPAKKAPPVKKVVKSDSQELTESLPSVPSETAVEGEETKQEEAIEDPPEILAA